MSIVEFIVGNTVEFVNVTMNMTMNPTNSDKASENRKKSLGAYLELNLRPSDLKESILTIRPRLIDILYYIALKCQKQKHSKNIVLLWPCGHKDQTFLAFWYKSKQDIFKDVKIQMKKDDFVLNLCSCLSDSLSHSFSNSI